MIAAIFDHGILTRSPVSGCHISLKELFKVNYSDATFVTGFLSSCCNITPALCVYMARDAEAVLGSTVQSAFGLLRSRSGTISSLPLDQLIARTAAGCRESFDEVYASTSRTSYAVLMAMLKNPDDARDALQEVYTRVWTKSHTFKLTGSDPTAWVKVIARNTAIDILRTRKRSNLHEVFEDVHEDSRGLSHPDRLTLHRCLEKLEPKRVELVKLVYIEGASYEEVASISDIPLNTVKSWLRRSLLQLKSCMSGG